MNDVDRTWLLIRSLLDWCPGPHVSRSQALPGFRSERQVSCEDCLANDRVLPSCPTCGGRGYVVVSGARDPMENPPGSREQRFYEDAFRHREAVRARDAEIDRLAELALVRDGLEAPGDLGTRMLSQRDRQYAAGDYAMLERVLDEFRRAYPGLHSVLWQVEVCGQPVRLAAVVRQAVDEAVRAVIAPRLVELCGGRLPRVPAWLVGQEERARAAQKTPLWQSRTADAKRARAARDARIRELAAEGKTAGEIARLVALTKRRVEQILAGCVAA